MTRHDEDLASDMGDGSHEELFPVDDDGRELERQWQDTDARVHEAEQECDRIAAQLADLERRFDAHVSATSNLAEAVRLAGEMIETEREDRRAADLELRTAIAGTDWGIGNIWRHLSEKGL